ncbi:hypothetical protein L4B83_26885 [Streptomyces sp. PSAA01]|nr:hypothetical protein [Streptomyces sp. PSAA01]MCG0288513.1 hypothetical protein [Streptomyces sp. PSAA01]
MRFISTRNMADASHTMFKSFTQRVKELGAQGMVLSGDPGEGDVFGGVRPRPRPPGRGFFVSRKRGVPLTQVGWLPEQ